VKRRLDKSSYCRKDESDDAKKRSRLLDVVAFGLPFACVVLSVVLLGNRSDSNDAPFESALEILESSKEVATGWNLAEQEASNGEKSVDNLFDVAPDSKELNESTAPNEQAQPSASEVPVVDEGQFPTKDKLSAEEAERLLAQLEFQLTSVKKSEETDVDSLLTELSTIRDATNELLENVPAEKTARARRTLDEIEALWRTLDANRAFFRRLKELDVASLDSDATRVFFNSIARVYSTENPENSDELDGYGRDFSRVVNSFEALQRVELWNEFIEKYGKALERFYISKGTADAALNFMRNYAATDGTPREIGAVARRERELEYAAQNEVATRRKILLRIESELAKKYWTYRRDEKNFYYLPTPPRVGANEYIASAQGELKSVDIPQEAPEVSKDESPQKSFLRELYACANEIQDETRAADVALWYRKWCDVLTKIQRTDRLDPILQYAFFRDVANILASSDYCFARRLEPLTRMLDVPQLNDLSKIDIFRSEEDETRNLRATARLRMTFMPEDHLTVDKTTEQLDANVARCAWRYCRVGWLDRNLAGEWRCRRSEDAPSVVGELWIFLTPDKQEDDSASTSKARWIKIGAIDGRQASVNLIASETPRGAIVFCRERIDRETSVAKRSSVERIFRR